MWFRAPRGESGLRQRRATACLMLFLTGCGGRVEVANPVDSKAVQDGGAGDGGGGSACEQCTGQQEDCNYCFIHGIDATYVCPTGASPPRSTCIGQADQHTNSKGYRFTCRYCP